MTALAVLTSANAALYFVAAILHTGMKIPLGPVTLALDASPPATIAETIIGATLMLAAVIALRTGASRLVWALYIFALAGTLFGFTIILLVGGVGPDLWVHFVMLAGLAGGFALLARSRRST